MRIQIETEGPVVALESAVITHGLPNPVNLQLVSDVQEEVRRAGAVPATVGILYGEVIVGLSEGEIVSLAGAPDPMKCSLRDIPTAVLHKATAGTTVAATMHIAYQAGLRVFATGGIGGVHRGHPFDVSADITALGRYPMTVVCSGAKAILDLSLTREALETQGVTVVGYQTDEFPAFYSRESGLSVDVRCDDVDEIAELVRRRDELELSAAILVCNPVPAECELPKTVMDAAIDQALEEAEGQGIQGKEVTPSLLARVSELTGEASLKANVGLLKSNARLAGEIAARLGP
ncbi:MAG: pseudouridine-5'-phosphate glycosidase [Verrucomicrobia bacterium]|nr:pseudouridine-5'-phosphate glycosidase [Verrucomicrobiota bacterium]